MSAQAALPGAKVDRWLDGWRRRPRTSALLLGGLAAFTLPPFHLYPLLLAFAGLLDLLRRTGGRRDALVLGWCFGFAHFLVGLYWIAVAPGSRGSPVASMLDDVITREVRESGGRWLLAETSSTPPYAAAHRFYAKSGYALLERIPDFYRPGDDRLTFGKRLDGHAPGAAGPPGQEGR